MLQDAEALRTSRQSAYEGDISPMRPSPIPPGDNPGTHFCYKLCQPQGHSATRKSKSVKYPQKICLASFCETFQWLKFPLNGLWAQSRVSPVVGLLPLASGLACLVMALPPFLMKQLYRCDSVIISSFVRIGYTTRR